MANESNGGSGAGSEEVRPIRADAARRVRALTDEAAPDPSAAGQPESVATGKERPIVSFVGSDTSPAGPPPPPELFRLAAHPLRWQVLCELARSDRRVRELTARLGAPQSLVSYHLGQLRAADLVAARRSSADGRDAFYRLDLDRYRELLIDAGSELHPGLDLSVSRGEPRARPRRSRVSRVLFLCTGNSARSQMAEALLEQLSHGTVEAFSGGSRPKPVHPNAVRVLRARGIDISYRDSKHFSTFARRRFDYVISLCDRVREVRREFPQGSETIHWSIPDPAAEPGSDADTRSAFEHTAAELETRIRFLLARIQLAA